MKTILTKVILTISTFFLAAFSQINAQVQADRKAKTTVLVIDNSEEIQNEVLLKKRLQRVQTIVWDACSQNDDKIIISYIFENSGIATNKTVYTLSLPSLNTKGLSPLKKKQMQRKFKQVVKQRRIEFVRNVTEKALAFNKERPRSHILDLLPLLNQFKQSFGVFDLHIISDLLEFSSYRNLHKTNLVSFDYAKKLGTIDSKKVAKKFKLNTSFFKDVSINIYFPVDAMESRPIFNLLPYYWEAVFCSYGASKSMIHFDKL